MLTSCGWVGGGGGWNVEKVQFSRKEDRFIIKGTGGKF